ncbi:MAG: 3'-5' exonuclease, partial [Roseobacter sp.]|jgi:ATP-dependent helicase/nuclease subunit A|nr:3'-5' exonuclease [Roseobacter sp.]
MEAMIRGPALIPDEDADGNQIMRPVRAGDFLILVQTRGPLFFEIIRAIKAKGMPIAGADRLKVGGELAVRDLAALLSFLAVPDDSLSLACALRAPLLGWSEQDLFDLAHRRHGDHLWQALRARSEEFPETMTVLNDLRRNIDFLRPYDLIERILTRHGGRRRLLARLGSEAEDGINALLTQALAYERNSVPSLTGFLSWMETDALEIKRQIDSSSDQVRVMTVHGAKGLEAPIVVLPDCGKRQNVVKDDVVTIDGKPAWKTAADDAPPAMAQTLARIKDAQEEERLRLLYVALTRAEKWLIVTAAGELSADGNTWYQMIDAALDAEGAVPANIDGMEIKRLQKGDWAAAMGVANAPQTEAPEPLEAYFNEAAPLPPDKPKSISPSDLGGAKALPGETGRSEEAAKAYGTLVHRFLEHFAAAPRAAWDGIARSAVEPARSTDDLAEAAQEAQRVLNNADLGALFEARSLAEVPLAADLNGLPLYGIVDRLVVTEDSVLAVDFKTNRTVPARAQDCPEGLLRQMGAYAHALAQIYPEKRIEVAILWTHSAELMELPHEIVMRALEDTPYLDGGPRAT